MTFIGWKVCGVGAAGDVAEERAHGGGGGGRGEGEAEALGGGEAAGEEAHGGALDVALDAGDLAGEAEAGGGLEAHVGVEEAGGVEEGVAVDAAEAGEGGVLEAGDGAEDFRLRAVLHLGLEADEVVEGAERVVAAELDDGVGFSSGACGLVRPTGFSGP